MHGNAGADAGGDKTGEEASDGQIQGQGEGRAQAAERREAAAAEREPAATGKAGTATKAEACLALLLRPQGATLEELQKLTGWLPHSVRGFLAGTVKKMAGLALDSEKAPGESRRYRVTRQSS